MGYPVGSDRALGTGDVHLDGGTLSTYGGPRTIYAERNYFHNLLI